MANSIAQDAIDRSISHTEIVTIDWDVEAFAELHRQSDEATRGNEVWDFCAADDDSDDEMATKWRVEMRFADDDAIRELRDESAQFGDESQVEICDSALEGDEHAVRQCQDLIEATARNQATL